MAGPSEPRDRVRELHVNAGAWDTASMGRGVRVEFASLGLALTLDSESARALARDLEAAAPAALVAQARASWDAIRSRGAA